MVCRARGQMQNLELNSFAVSDMFFLCVLVSFFKCNLQVNMFYLRVRKRIMLTCGVVALQTNKNISRDSLVAFICLLKIGALILLH